MLEHTKMLLHLHKRGQMRLVYISIFILISLLGLFWQQYRSAQAHPQLERSASPHLSLNGRVGFSGNPATNEGQTCTACHATGATVPTVALDGPTTVQAGSTNRYTVTITGGPAQTGGVNISAGNERGTLLPTGADLQAFLGELTHSAPKPFTDNQVRFSFVWTAPSFNDTVTLYAAGNSTDSQQSLTGDGVANTTLAVQVTGGNGGPPAASPTPSPATLGLTLITDGVNQPTDITHAGDGRLFIAQKNGQVRIFENGTLLATPFLNLAGKVTAGGGNAETGLLGLAFHPNYASNGYLYVNYTVSNPNLRTRISRFTRAAGDPNVVDNTSELILLEFVQPYVNHNGGQIHFGDDGYLYIASGDGGSSGDPDNYGQNNTVLLGKILRIDVNNGGGAQPDCDLTGNSNYRIPADNPFADGAEGNCDEIWATGLRNPWRFSFDRLTGDMWIGDVGQNRIEEIDFAPASSNGGENYGWRCYEGNSVHNTNDCGPASSYVAPIYDYNRSNGDCSVTGGYVYRGNRYPNLNGHYFFSDFCNKTIRSISGAPEEPLVTSWSTTGGGSNPITFGQDINGELYVGYGSGSVYQLTGITVGNTPTPTATSTPLPTDTPTPASTVTATNTPLPTNTPTATSTPTTTPTPTATPTGAIVQVDSVTVVANEPITPVLPVNVINIPTGANLGAVTVDVLYDSALLTFDDCLTPTPNRFDSMVCNGEEAGVVRISALSSAGLDGEAKLALLKFTSMGSTGRFSALSLTLQTFVDTDGESIAVSLIDGSVIFPCPAGDVDCSGAVNPFDALFMVQYVEGVRPATETIPPPNGFLYLPACDLNGDEACTTEDARLILQCEVGESNALCSE